MKCKLGLLLIKGNLNTVHVSIMGKNPRHIDKPVQLERKLNLYSNFLQNEDCDSSTSKPTL
jgi:hypothetical protein